MNHLVAKMHAQPSLNKLNVCPICEQEFSSYYCLQEQGAKQQKPSDTFAELNRIVEEEGEDGEKFKEEFNACQLYLVDTEMENGR